MIIICSATRFDSERDRQLWWSMLKIGFALSGYPSKTPSHFGRILKKGLRDEGLTISSLEANTWQSKLYQPRCPRTATVRTQMP